MSGAPESARDYPRPPRVEPTTRRLRVVFAGITIAETTNGLRVLETSHPPTFYIPPGDVRRDFLEPMPGRSVCEWKGTARHWTIAVGDRRAERAAWSYPAPTPDFEAIRDHLCFYPGRVDACFVDDERVAAQEGGFYGGWITRNVVGPFEGGPGTLGW